MDGAEIFLERLKEILRTEHRNSLLGAECVDANSARSKKRVICRFIEEAQIAILQIDHRTVPLSQSSVPLHPHRLLQVTSIPATHNQNCGDIFTHYFTTTFTDFSPILTMATLPGCMFVPTSAAPFRHTALPACLPSGVKIETGVPSSIPSTFRKPPSL